MTSSHLINYSASKIATCILKIEKQVPQKDMTANVVFEHRLIFSPAKKTYLKLTDEKIIMPLFFFFLI